MRISTNSFFENSSSRLTSLQSKISATYDQISSGRRVLNPSDDPVAAAKIINVQHSQGMNTQLNKNISSIQNNLGLVDTKLTSITDNLQSMHEQIISAGNGTYSDSDKAAVSASLQGYYDQLLTLANSTDSAGNYLFSGKKSDTAPFVINSHQVTAGQLGEYKASSFTIPSGNTTWLDVNGSVLAAGSVPESESGKIFYSASTSTPPTFADAPTGAAKVTISSVTYQGDSEQSQIQVNNSRKMSASVVGSDLFAGGDIFNKLQAAITALNTPTNGSASKASTQASVLSDLNSSFNATFAAVSTAQSSVGTRLKSLDDLKTASGNLDLQLAQTLSGLQDVDYNKAVSDLTRQQFILQAAQQTFAKIGKSSLFDYMA